MDDAFLVGSIDYLDGASNNVTVKESGDYNRVEMREEILQTNPKYITKVELEVANNVEANSVHMTIVETEESTEEIIV